MRKNIPKLTRPKPLLLALALPALMAGVAFGQNVLQPTDPIIASSSNEPGSEGVANAIDGTTAKYLNFDSANDAKPSGFAVTPSVGATWITGMAIQSANDSPGRDPKEVQLEGSNDTITNYTDGNWTLIADIQVPAFTNRFQWQTFTFTNFSPYTSYRWIVVHITDPTQNSMQVSEVQLLGTTVPKNVLQPTDAIIASSSNEPGSEGVANAIDGTTAKYLNFDSANDAKSSGFVVTPGVGATVAQGLAIQSANDSPGRDPKEVRLEGSNDDPADYTTGTWTQIADLQVPAFASRFQWQTFLFPNVMPYKHYRWTSVHITDPTQNSMQVAEVQILGTGAPQNILLPTDPIIASSSNEPGSEGVANAIDGTTAKYLNFDSANDAKSSGFVVTPSVGATVITGLALESANDSPGRDPKEVLIEGSNDDTADYTTGTWTTIADISVPVFTNRFEWQYFYFANSASYKHYRWTSLHITDPTQNSMQISEVELLAVTSKADCSKAAFVSTPVQTPVLSGAQAEFFVEVNGPWPLQWMTNGVPVPGANQPDFTTETVTAANADILYSVAIVGCQTSPPVHAVIFTPSTVKSVGMQFIGGTANGAGTQGFPRSAMDPDLIAGVQPQAYFNVVTNDAHFYGTNTDATTMADTLLDSDGNPTQITFEYKTTGAWGAGVGSDTPTERLLNGIAGASKVSSGEQTMIFHNVSATSCALLIYSVGPPLQFQNVKFAVTNQNLVVYQRTLESGEYKLAPGFYRSTSTDPSTPSIGDFVRFDGVKPDANGDVVLSFWTLTDADRETGVNAIQLLLNAPNPGAPPVITQQPAQTVGPTNGMVTLTAGVTGDGLTYQWRKNGQNLFNGGNISGANSATLVISPLTAADQGIYSVAIFNQAGSTVSKNASVSLSAYDIKSGLAGYWQFDDGSGDTATNSVAGGLPVTLLSIASTPPTWAAGQIGSSVVFDGLSFGVVSNFPKATKAIAGSAWVKIPTGTIGAGPAVIFRNQEGAFLYGGTANRLLGQFDLSLAWDNTAMQYFPSATIGLGNNYVSLTGPTNITMGSWHQIAFSADGAQLTLYIDGAKTAALDYTGDINPPSMPELYIGGQGTNDISITDGPPYTLDQTALNALTGQLDELALWDRALTPSEVQAIYTAEKAGKALTTVTETPPATAPPSLKVTASGGNVTVTWDHGTLATAPSLSGPWTDQPTAASPLTEPIAGAKFYRAHN